MLVAVGPNHRVHTATELQPKLNNGPGQSKSPIYCPICKRRVTENPAASNLLSYFEHADGTTDCFASNAVSLHHRFAVEVTVKTLFNRIREVTGEPACIDLEKWIGTRGDFVIPDILLSDPINIAVEVFYKTETLGLRRRLKTMFNHGYRAYLVFHTGGRHSPTIVDQHLQRISSLKVGRFNPRMMDADLGDLFSSNQIDINQLGSDQFPTYLLV